jgi:hypothetical protein
MKVGASTRAAPSIGGLADDEMACDNIRMRNKISCEVQPDGDVCLPAPQARK